MPKILISPLAPRGRGLGRGGGGMKSDLCHELLMPQGSYLFCFAKKGNPKKAAPTFALIRALKRNVARSETRYAQTTDRFIDVFASNLGGEYTGPIEPMFDRFAMTIQC